LGPGGAGPHAGDLRKAVIRERELRDRWRLVPLSLALVSGRSAQVLSYLYIKVQAMKTFTVEEAQSLLPVLESLLKRAIESKRAADEVEAGLGELARRVAISGGMRVDVGSVTKLRAEMEAHLQRARESMAEIDSIGVQVKDLEAGLLDFPCTLDGEVVLLCWRMGEPSIEHWHTMESGFQGRQPLDDRFRRRTSSGGRPN
jgi:hypothetical protein